MNAASLSHVGVAGLERLRIELPAKLDGNRVAVLGWHREKATTVAADRIPDAPPDHLSLRLFTHQIPPQEDVGLLLVRDRVESSVTKEAGTEFQVSLI